MSKVSGHGGYWVLPPGFQASNYGTIVHNAEYEVLTEAEARETRSVGCGGWTEGLPKVRRVEHAVLKVAEDDVSYPQVLGFTEGREISFYLRRGALNQFDLVVRAIVQAVRVVNSQVKARRVEVVCRHGVYQRGVAPPSLPPSSTSASAASGTGGGGDF